MAYKKLNQAALQKISKLHSAEAHWFVVRDLVYNAHDADADRVKVTLHNFDKNYRIKKESKIIAEDNGTGIKKEMLENWFVPSTSTKKKKGEPKKKTAKGRSPKGGGGGGRFSFLGLGKKVKIVTRTNENKSEYILNYDFSKFKSGSEKSLDDVKISLTEREPEDISKQGTIIEISALCEDWNEILIENLYEQLLRRQFAFKLKNMKDFDAYIYKDDICTHHILYSDRSKLLIWIYVIYKHIFAEFAKMRIVAKSVLFKSIAFVRRIFI